MDMTVDCDGQGNVEALEAWFQKTGEKAEFRLAPLESKLYVIRTEEIEIKPEPVKKFNIYDNRSFCSCL